MSRYNIVYIIYNHKDNLKNDESVNLYIYTQDVVLVITSWVLLFGRWPAGPGIYIRSAGCRQVF